MMNRTHPLACRRTVEAEKAHCSATAQIHLGSLLLGSLRLVLLAYFFLLLLFFFFFWKKKKKKSSTLSEMH